MHKGSPDESRRRRPGYVRWGPGGLLNQFLFVSLAGADWPPNAEHPVRGLGVHRFRCHEKAGKLIIKLTVMFRELR